MCNCFWFFFIGPAATELYPIVHSLARHYALPSWLGAGPREQAVIAHEFAMRGWAQPSTVIGEWVLPTILEHGNAEQQDRFVEPSLRADIIWRSEEHTSELKSLMRSSTAVSCLNKKKHHQANYMNEQQKLNT